jgi:hypothetical protein
MTGDPLGPGRMVESPPRGGPTDADKLAALRLACTVENNDICQTLGAALNYPRYADDPAIFSGATDADGVCTGEHVAASLAAEAAREITRLRAELAVERARFAASERYAYVIHRCYEGYDNRGREVVTWSFWGASSDLRYDTYTEAIDAMIARKKAATGAEVSS